VYITESEEAIVLNLIYLTF